MYRTPTTYYVSRYLLFLCDFLGTPAKLNVCT